MQARAHAFRALHGGDELLVLANAWDVVSARAVAAVDGIHAVATTSHGIAAAFGFPDGEQIPLGLHLEQVARMAAGVDVPVTMDLEAGYGDPAGTVRRAIEAGAVGANLEDQLKPLDEAVAAVEAAVAAAREAGVPDFVLNARTDAFVRGGMADAPDRVVEDAIERLRAYLDAGAPVVFAPAAIRREHVEALVAALPPRTLTLVAFNGVGLPLRELHALGVVRVSTGPFTQRVALTALQEAAEALVAGDGLPAARALN